MARYKTKQAENGLWMVVEEGSTNPVAAGQADFQTAMSEDEARKLAEEMNAKAAAGQDERQ